MPPKKHYDSLYFEIIKFAMKQPEDGVSYNNLKAHLESIGYDFSNDCIELAVKQRFLDCFHHYIEDGYVFEKIQDIKNHLDCNCILNGESCIAYINYKTAKYNANLALLAVLISIIGLIWSLRTQDKISTKDKTQQEEHLPIPYVSTPKYISPKP